MGNAYLELVTVVDEGVAGRCSFGRWVASARPAVVQPIGWAVRTTSIDVIAERHGLSVTTGSRAAPSGRLLSWRLAGVERAAAEPSLPFFIEWGDGTPHPSRALRAGSNASVDVARLELTGDVHRIRQWLGDLGGRVVVDAGPPGLAKVVLLTPGGEVRIDADLR